MLNSIMIFTKKNNIIGFLILLWSNFAICQNKSIPYSFQKDCSDSIKNALISSYYHPGLNKQDLEDEDRLTSNNRVAQFIELRIDPNQEGTRNSVKKLNKSS